MSAALTPEQMRDRIMYDQQFQAACQRYAHGTGSSSAIAAAAVRIVQAEITRLHHSEAA